MEPRRFRYKVNRNTVCSKASPELIEFSAIVYGRVIHYEFTHHPQKNKTEVFPSFIDRVNFSYNFLLQDYIF